MTIKECPCGEKPEQLYSVDSGEGGKWAFVYGSCCCEWHINYRTNYKELDSDECKELALSAWNNAGRKNDN